MVAAADVTAPEPHSKTPPSPTYLDKVFLDAAGSGDQDVHQLVLHQKPNVLPNAGRDQVGGVAQENLGAHVVSSADILARCARLVRQPPPQLQRCMGITQASSSTRRAAAPMPQTTQHASENLAPGFPATTERPLHAYHAVDLIDGLPK